MHVMSVTKTFSIVLIPLQTPELQYGTVIEQSSSEEQTSSRKEKKYYVEAYIVIQS